MAYIGREPQIGNYQVCDAIWTDAVKLAWKNWLIAAKDNKLWHI